MNKPRHGIVNLNEYIHLDAYWDERRRREELERNLRHVLHVAWMRGAYAWILGFLLTVACLWIFR